MITIPEHIYNKDTIRFVCPSLEMSLDEAVQMLAALTNPIWQEALRSEKCICHAFHKLGFNTAKVSAALVKRYHCGSLNGCLLENLPGKENWEKRFRIANLIRQSWSDHMRAQLKYIIAQE